MRPPVLLSDWLRWGRPWRQWERAWTRQFRDRMRTRSSTLPTVVVNPPRALGLGAPGGALVRIGDATNPNSSLSRAAVGEAINRLQGGGDAARAREILNRITRNRPGGSGGLLSTDR